ncbi:Oidioi.mRNA.OKI2018_I69.PAR.g9185.t1.cds [Oikopleura dioica]|uniref:Oidioi.mRNA.OKI2018_I69.PAR.g9185.t1.cds n=1 Tax=Oikopleura dioica TaxID=34765 RepID=A0ABN7RNR8_OIKDI|nr:Oidioi.mRNA.OKI2018_I69.PAR.g9185.t1.cds [Oikopleura dioica]
MDFWTKERIQARFDEIWSFGQGSQRSHVDTPMPCRRILRPQDSLSSMSSTDPSDQYEVNLSMKFSNDKESFRLQKNFVFGEKQSHEKHKKARKGGKKVRLATATEKPEDTAF